MDPKFLVLGNLLTQTATPANVAAAAAIVPGIKLPFANFSGRSVRCSPLPQYNSVTEAYNNDGQSNYNALQLPFSSACARADFQRELHFQQGAGNHQWFSQRLYPGEEPLNH